MSSSSTKSPSIKKKVLDNIEIFHRWPLSRIVKTLSIDLSLRPQELEPLLSINYNFAESSLNIICHLIKNHASVDVDWNLFEENPYELFLHLLTVLLEVRTDFSTILSLVSKNKFEESYVGVITGKYYCLVAKQYLPVTSMEVWRHYSKPLLLASPYPIQGCDLISITGVYSLAEIESVIENYKNSGKLGKRFFNIDKNAYSFEKTWSKMFNDQKLFICSESEQKLKFFSTILEAPSVTTKDSPKKRKNIPKSVRELIWRRDCGETLSGNCFCCGSEIRHEAFEAGHIHSAAEGGSDDITNLKVICIACNRSMGKTNMKDFCARFYSSRQYNWDSAV